MCDSALANEKILQTPELLGSCLDWHRDRLTIA